MQRLCLVLLLALGLVGCAREAAQPPNLVLVVVDTLRADRLACYGDRKGLMPFVNSLAKRAVVFEHAYAQGPWTIPSVGSLLTSRYQAETGMIFFNSVLSENEITLAEALHGHGYLTGGFSANGVLDPQHGWGQGYDHYDANPGRPPANEGDLYHPRRADELNRDAFAWLDQARARDRAPFFLYLQYMEPHVPYEPPKDILDRLFDGKPPRDLLSFSTRQIFRSAVRFDPATVGIIEKLYDGEVISVDRGIQDLFDQLRQRHLLHDTVVVFTADHGNEFYEHGQIGHGQSLYNELIHVPLLVLMPGQTRRVDVAQPVALIDLAPTLLAEAGIPAPPRYEGRSLAALLDPARPGWRGWLARLRRREPEPRPIVSELIREPKQVEPRLTPHLRAIILGSHKLIAGVDGEEIFYDLAADPGEKHPDALDPAARKALRQAMETYLAHIAKEPTPLPPKEIDPGTRERLRALGYVD